MSEVSKPASSETTSDKVKYHQQALEEVFRLEPKPDAALVKLGIIPEIAVLKDQAYQAVANRYGELLGQSGVPENLWFAYMTGMVQGLLIDRKALALQQQAEATERPKSIKLDREAAEKMQAILLGRMTVKEAGEGFSLEPDGTLRIDLDEETWERMASIGMIPHTEQPEK